MRFNTAIPESSELLDALTILFGYHGITEFAMIFAGFLGVPHDETGPLVIHRKRQDAIATISQFTLGMMDGRGRLRETDQDELSDDDRLDLLRCIDGHLAGARQVIDRCKALPGKYIIIGL